MKKLALVGSHRDTRDNAPWDDGSFDIWVFNEAAQHDWCKRWDACFQLHRPEVYTSIQNVNHSGHWDWLQQDHGLAKIIWMQDTDTRVPNSARYPMDKIKTALPAASFGWFTSTASMALALALFLRYDYIEVYGIDLSSGTEYAYQQANWIYWVGVAKTMLGNNLVLRSGTQHFEGRVYGYDGEVQITPDYFAARVSLLEGDKKYADEQLRRMRDRLSAAILDNKPAEFAELIVEAQNIAQQAGEISGQLQEARAYAARTDPISRQQFERRGAQAQIDGDKARSLMDKESGKTEYVWNVWKASGNYEAIKQLRMFYGELLKLSLTVGGNLGVWHENAKYMLEYDARVTAAGGERTRKALGL